MLRHRKKTLQVVKKLDAFPKTSEECVEATTTGGTSKLSSFFSKNFYIVTRTNLFIIDVEIHWWEPFRLDLVSRKKGEMVQRRLAVFSAQKELSLCQ